MSMIDSSGPAVGRARTPLVLSSGLLRVLTIAQRWRLCDCDVPVFQTTAFRPSAFRSLPVYLERCNVTNTMAQSIAETCKQLRSLSILYNRSPYGASKCC